MRAPVPAGHRPRQLWLNGNYVLFRGLPGTSTGWQEPPACSNVSSSCVRRFPEAEDNCCQGCNCE